jgi:thioredoxin 1
MGTIKEINEKDFEQEVTNSTVPVLVDFWAPWCGPCRMQTPVLEKLAKEVGPKMKVLKVNTDENQNLAQRFSVFSIPSLMLFKDGKLSGQWVGFQSERELKAKLGL